MAENGKRRTVNGGRPNAAQLRALESPEPPPDIKEAKGRSLLGSMLDRLAFRRSTGLTFRNPQSGQFMRDTNLSLGYLDSLSVADFRGRYERGGVAETIMETFPDATWGGGCELIEDPDPDTETNFELAAAELFRRYDLWNKLRRADILSGFGRYGVILIGARGDLKSPLPDLSGKDALLYFTPLAEDNAKIHSFVDDVSNPRFGRPEYYQLTLGTSIDGNPGLFNKVGTPSPEVHWTRVIHLAEGKLDNEIFGKPRLRAVWNYLDDLLKVVGGGAEASWKRMDPGMHLDVDAEADLTPEDEDRMDEELEDFRHNMTRVLRTRGTKVNLLSAPVAGFGPNVTSIMSLISATTKIPQRILTGSERGELASTQDRKNWSDRVMSRRESFALPIIHDLIDRLIDKGALPQPSGYMPVWNEIQELDEHEKATVANSLTSANSLNATAEGKIIMTSDEIRVHVLNLEPSDETEIVVEEPLDEVPPTPGDEDGEAGDEDGNKNSPTPGEEGPPKTREEFRKRMEDRYGYSR
jgi:hypothetical protein